ncbi:atp-dependent protease la 2 [Ceraceosorus bombacis]|uniref:Lon protease homolog n=1 Tax=Ceraceosorus bombacis TaxID=401625 RepID=A0A0P1BCZ4_9BASI|nr:atp-dependent protease la 2 [Ceraceosorus bombacis]
MPSETIVIPERLPVLPLPYPLVLHPSLLLSIPLSYAHSLSLLKAALQVGSDEASDASSSSKDGEATRPIVVACVPTMRVPAGASSNPAKPSTTRSVMPKDEANDPRVRINDLYDWGVAAKLVRLTRHPASQTCTLVVTGVTRVRIDRWLSVRAPLTSTKLDRNITVPDVPVPLAAITGFADGGPFPPLTGATENDMDAVRALRAAADELLESLSALGAAPSVKNQGQDNALPPALPLLPSGLLRRVRAFVKESREGQAGMLADVLVGTLGGACEWSQRVNVLGEWEPRYRVKAAASALSAGAARVRLARELLASLAAPLSSNTKESLVRTQLESLLAQLAALNPNTTARISTGTNSFSIGPANRSDTGSSGKDNNGSSSNPNNSNAIITIRAPSRPNDGMPRSAPGARSVGGGGSSGGSGAGDQEEEDEVAELTRKLDAAMLTPEARKMCDRELKRLARIPQQSVERGVVITYLETMAELPWDKTSADLSPQPSGPKDAAAPSAITEVADVDVGRSPINAPIEDEGIVERARRILDEDHYGLEKIKKRLVEYLAVLELKTSQAQERIAREEKLEREERIASRRAERAAVAKKQSAAINQELEEEGDFQHLEEAAEEEKKSKQAVDEARRKRRRAHVADKGPILLLVGPPGTGKTSIAKSLATALKRPFTRVSLGGVRDEAEIRGHRRTYVGAMPGTIASSLRKVGVSDPVLLLDEIDKLGSGNGLHGDPMAAMLETLDPEQNHAFNDHYVNCPIDLSRVLFIATANTLDTISPPLLDRTEVINVSGYTHDEKVAIARNYLLPKQTKAQGLVPEDLVVGDDVLLKVAMSYTREAGVRSLEREIGAIARSKAVEYAEARKGVKGEDGKPKSYDPVVRVEDLERILGVETYEPEVAELESRPGVATGLAYQGSGSGGILHIESVLLPPDNGALKLTGSLGDVIRESAELALSWVKAHSYQLGITPSRDAEFPRNGVHIHFPSLSTPKDGPSASVALVLALVTLFTRVSLDPKLAVTGEMDLRGRVTPVGGIKEKLIGAHRAGIKRVILPARNKKDVVADLPQNVKDDLRIHYVSNVWNALEIALGESLFAHANGDGVAEGKRMMGLEDITSRL